MVKWLRENKLQLNPDKTEVILIWKAEFLQVTMLPTTSGGQLTLTDSIKNTGLILDPALFLKKKVKTAAKRHSGSFV